MVTRINQFIITADKVMDFIPLASTLNNAAILISKCALKILSSCCPDSYESIKNWPIVDHIQHKKSPPGCFLLAIPIFNIFIAMVLHCYSEEHEPTAAPKPPKSKVDYMVGVQQSLGDAQAKFKDHAKALNANTRERYLKQRTEIHTEMGDRLTIASTAISNETDPVMKQKLEEAYAQLVRTCQAQLSNLDEMAKDQGVVV